MSAAIKAESLGVMLSGNSQNQVGEEDPRAQRKAMEEKLVEVMNSQFGYDGFFFSVDDNPRAEQTEKPSALSLYHNEKFERVGVLDTEDKYLLDFCDTAIKKHKTALVEARKELITVKREYDISRDEYVSKSRNILNRIFRKRMLQDCRERLDIQERIYFKHQEILEATEHSLQLEQVIKIKVRALMNQLRAYGFENESA